MDGIIEFLTDWGYVGLFLSAFIAGSIVPFSSEVVMVALVHAGLDPWACLACAAAGNTAGGMTCYWIGTLGKQQWIEKYLRVSPEQLEKARRFMGTKGACMGFFAFMPYIGEAIAIVLGLMRSNVWITCITMFAGKAARYAVIFAAYLGLTAV